MMNQSMRGKGGRGAEEVQMKEIITKEELVRLLRTQLGVAEG